MSKRTAVLRRVAAVAVLVATLAAVGTAAPRDAQAFAWKDVCQFTILNNTGKVTGIKPTGPLIQLPPNPVDEFHWEGLAVPLIGGIPGSLVLTTAGIPVTWGCSMKPVFKWGSNATLACNVFAPSSGRNIFQCIGSDPNGFQTRILTDNADIKGVVTANAPFAQASSARRASAGSAAVPRQPKRVRALLRRRDLPGRGWRAAKKVTQFGRLGKIFAANDAPASCKDDKTSEPLAKRGGASAFARRGNIIGYEHGVYASRRKSRGRLRAAVSAHSIRCLAGLLTSAQFHTRAKFARYSLPGLEGVRLWRVVVRTREGGRVTRTDYVDVAGLLHRRSNGLVLLAKPRKPVTRRVERSVIRTVARRLPSR
jgi:hypothetical protein